MCSVSDKIIRDALTYDDVLVVPAYSEVLPKEVDLSTRLTPKITLYIPLISSAMDTVTDAELAIAMALEGGLGIIHKNMSIEQQAEAVRKVKRSQSSMIQDPLFLNAGATTGEAIKLMEVHKIGGIPIVDNKQKLVGIVTKRDLRFEQNMHRPITDAMTAEPITLQENQDTQKAKNILERHKIEKLPIIDKKGRLKGLITYKDIIKKKDRPYACKDAFERLCVGAALGVNEQIMQRAEALVRAGVDLLCIDTAHGHSLRVLEATERIREHFPDTELMVGNIATAEAAEALIKRDVHVVKVGVGPGSICTTRIVTGIGVPQLSAVMQVSEVLSHVSATLVADGGIRFSGDIVKAIVGGADAVMLGSLLAGTEEAPGELILLQGKKYKSYRGMGSVEAMRAGSTDRYAQAPTVETKKLVPEGIVGRVPYRGHVSEVLYQLVGGLRAGMGYVGAQQLFELKNGTFIRITSAGHQESHPHDVTITQEAPNYF